MFDKRKRKESKIGLLIILIIFSSIIIIGLLWATDTTNAKRSSCEMAKYKFNSKKMVQYCDTELIFDPKNSNYHIDIK